MNYSRPSCCDRKPLTQRLTRAVLPGLAAILLTAALSGCAANADTKCPLTSAQVEGIVNGSASATYKSSTQQTCTYSLSDTSEQQLTVQWIPYAGSGFRGESSLRQFGYTDMPASQSAQLGAPALVATFPSTSSSPDPATWIIFNHDGYSWSVGLVGSPNDSIARTMSNRTFAVAQLIAGKSFPKP